MKSKSKLIKPLVGIFTLAIIGIVVLVIIFLSNIVKKQNTYNKPKASTEITVGSKCNPNTNEPCGRSMYCDSNNTCQMKKKPGVSCTSTTKDDKSCMSGKCDIDKKVCLAGEYLSYCTVQSDCNSKTYCFVKDTKNGLSSGLTGNYCFNKKDLTNSCDNNYECKSNICAASRSKTDGKICSKAK